MLSRGAKRHSSEHTSQLLSFRLQAISGRACRATPFQTACLLGQDAECEEAHPGKAARQAKPPRQLAGNPVGCGRGTGEARLGALLQLAACKLHQMKAASVQPLATTPLATLPQEVLTRVCLPPAAAATLLLRRPQCVTHAALGIRAAASASAAGDGLVGLLLRLLLLRSRTARQPACRRTEQQVCVVGGERRRRRHQPEM